MKGVLFDLDGTLVYTLPDINAALNYALSRHYGQKVKEIELEECRVMVGHGLKNLVELSLQKKDLKPTEEEIELIYSYLMGYYCSHCVVCSKPYDGIVSLVNKLKKEGVEVGVFSNKQNDLVKEIVNTLFGEKFFDFVLGMGGGFKAKPDPQGVLYFNKKYSIDLSYYVGDSEVDYYTGINAYSNTIITSWGFRTLEELEASGINEKFIVNTIDDLYNKIEGSL